MLYISEFQPFSSPGTHKLITQILQRTKKCVFADLTKKKKGVILIHCLRTAIVVLAVVISLCDHLREGRSGPRPSSWVLAVLRIPAAHRLKVADLHHPCLVPQVRFLLVATTSRTPADEGEQGLMQELPEALYLRGKTYPL